MKLGILLSGGKDSVYSSELAKKEHEVVCAISIKSKNKESYMFHTPNINLVQAQAQAMKIPLILVETEGEKEKELKELHQAIKEAKEKYGIEGVASGAVASQYQASRVQRICYELDLWCFNPLWQINQIQLLEELLQKKFEVMIVGVFAYPFTKELLGKIIDRKVIDELKIAEEKYKINPAGEGGEIETLVIDCPLFEKKIEILKAKIKFEDYAGTYDIEEAKLSEKKQTIVEEESKIEILNEGKDVLIINTVDKKLKLFENEFIRPLVDICREQKYKQTIISISELKSIEGFQKIIISGTGLKDNKFLEHKEKMKIVFEGNVPVLGICAGAELLLPEDHTLEEIFEIGPKVLEELNEDTLTNGLDGKEAYFLHQKGLRTIPFTSELIGLLASEKGIAAFKYKNKNIYGTQFHPEVNHKSFIKQFLKL